MSFLELLHHFVTHCSMKSGTISSRPRFTPPLHHYALLPRPIALPHHDIVSPLRPTTSLLLCRTWLEDGGTDGDGPWGKSCNAFMNRTAFQPCLFDLYGDISETIDIATAEAAKVQAMWASLNATVSTSYVSAFRGSATTAQRPDRQPPPGAPQIPHGGPTHPTHPPPR